MGKFERVIWSNIEWLFFLHLYDCHLEGSTQDKVTSYEKSYVSWSIKFWILHIFQITCFGYHQRLRATRNFYPFWLKYSLFVCCTMISKFWILHMFWLSSKIKSNKKLLSILIEIFTVCLLYNDFNFYWRNKTNNQNIYVFKWVYLLNIQSKSFVTCNCDNMVLDDTGTICCPMCVCVCVCEREREGERERERERSEYEHCLNIHP